MRSRSVMSIIASLLVYGLCGIAGVGSALAPFRFVKTKEPREDLLPNDQLLKVLSEFN